jgi:hypothetical protein
MLFYLFEFISPCISSLFLPEISFSNNQMVTIRSGEGQDNLSVVCVHIANQQTQASPPPINPAMDPATQQFLVTQMRLIQNLTITIQNIQA